MLGEEGRGLQRDRAGCPGALWGGDSSAWSKASAGRRSWLALSWRLSHRRRGPMS